MPHAVLVVRASCRGAVPHFVFVVLACVRPSALAPRPPTAPYRYVAYDITLIGVDLNKLAGRANYIDIHRVYHV